MPQDIESRRSHPRICLGGENYVNGRLLAVASVTVSCDIAHKEDRNHDVPVKRRKLNNTPTIQHVIFMGFSSRQSEHVEAARHKWAIGLGEDP